MSEDTDVTCTSCFKDFDTGVCSPCVRALIAENARLRADNARLSRALEEVAAIPPEHAAKLPWSSYHALLRAIGKRSAEVRCVDEGSRNGE